MDEKTEIEKEYELVRKRLCAEIKSMDISMYGVNTTIYNYVHEYQDAELMIVAEQLAGMEVAKSGNIRVILRYFIMVVDEWRRRREWEKVKG
jgi:hypothetical protein